MYRRRSLVLTGRMAHSATFSPWPCRLFDWGREKTIQTKEEQGRTLSLMMLNLLLILGRLYNSFGG